MTSTKDNQSFLPVTFGDVSKPPFDRMPDSTVVPTLGQSMLCSKCGTKGKIWSVPEFHGASAETLKRWRQAPD